MDNARSLDRMSWLIALAIGTVAWTGALAQTRDSTDYISYPCRFMPASEVEKLLADLLPDDPAIQLVADTQNNRLLLRGPASVHRIAKSLLESVDRPSSRRAEPVRPAETPEVRSYRCPPGQLDRWLTGIRQLDGKGGLIKATAAPETNQLLVLATPSDHQRIERQFGLSVGQATNPGGQLRLLPPPNRSSTASSTASVDRVLHVRAGRVNELEQRIVGLFSGRLKQTRRDRQVVYLLEILRGGTLEFQFDNNRNIVLARGPNSAVTQFGRLVSALDVPAHPGHRVEALRVERTEPMQLHHAVDAYRGQLPRRNTDDSKKPSVGDQSWNGAARHRSAVPGAVHLVNYLFQNQDELGQGTGTDPTGSQTVPNITGLEDLEVQTLSDLDVIILRGRSQDVEQLTKIIRELEKLSEETKPKIHIYYLQHTQGESITQIIEQVQVDLIGGRQGRVSITPLAKPNALLLIGWGEAVDSMITLIHKLDQPVAPESQFAVFGLQHAAVTTVQQTIEDFFGNRPGLGPNVQTAADTRTNKLIVYAAPRDMQEVRRLVEQLDVAKSGAVNRARIFRITNALASDVAQTLQQTLQAAGAGQAGRSAVLEFMTMDERGQRALSSGMLDEVRITPNPRNNTLIVTGPPETMDLIEAFIKQFDTETDRAQIKVFRVINGDAASLVTVLRSLIPSQIGQTIGPQLSNAPDEDALVPLRFSVEVRSNSIIAIGSEGDLRIAEALLVRLDESESMNRRNAVYLLKNSPALDVAAAVNDFLRSQRQVELAAPGQANPFQDLEREVIVVPEPVGNRLIVSATPRYFDEITGLIEKLDEPPPQVVIQIMLAEVTLNNADELGFELGLQDSVLFDRSLLGDLLTTTQTNQASDVNGILTSTQEIIQAATNTPGFAFNNTPVGNSGSTQALNTAGNVGGQALSHFELGRTNNQIGYGGLVLSASSQNVSVLIRALEENKQLNVLSRPLIRTLDNQPAYIQVGQRVPRIIGSNVNNYGQSNSVTLENVGLILGVTPRISPDGNVVMEIDAEKSEVGPESEGIPVSVSMDGTLIRSPRIDTVTAQATVSTADGETVVIGGMIMKKKEVISRRAPFLSDIPVVGNLFKYDSSTTRRSELLIILTPHVIRTQEDSDRIKQSEFARMSWCAADVYDINGDVGMNYAAGLGATANDTDATVIYPDLNPRGEVNSPAPRATGPPPSIPGPMNGPQPSVYGPQPAPPAVPPANAPPVGREAMRTTWPGTNTVIRQPR